MIGRTLCAAVEDNIAKRGILTCCNAGHTLPATPAGNMQAAGARSGMRGKAALSGGAELLLFTPVIAEKNPHKIRRTADAPKWHDVVISTRSGQFPRQKPPIPVFHKVKYRLG